MRDHPSTDEALLVSGDPEDFGRFEARAVPAGPMPAALTEADQ